MKVVDIEPLIALGRDAHPPDGCSRYEEPASLNAPAGHAEQMKQALKTRAGSAACPLRKLGVEPMFGIIKSGMEVLQFLLGGLDNLCHEWTLVCLASNLACMAGLRLQ